MASGASSSDSDDDEERQKLAQALDPDFLKNGKTNQLNSKCTKGASSGSLQVSSNDQPVSKRSKIFDPNVDSNEFVKPYSLDVTPECQNFIAKQLAKALERDLKEKSLPIQSTAQDDDMGIKLFATSTSPVTENDLTKKVNQESKRRLVTKKRKKKKPNKSKDSSESSSESETEKLKSVAVSAAWVLHSGT